MSESKQPCLYPDCGKPIKTRGLYNNHYASVFYYIKHGKVTEEQLVEARKMAPKLKNLRLNWFLEGLKK